MTDWQPAISVVAPNATSARARTAPCRRGNQPFMTACLIMPQPVPIRRRDPRLEAIHRNRRKVLLFQPDAAHRRGCFSQDSAVSDFSAACLADPSRNSCPVVSQQRMREFCEIPAGVSRASHGAAVKLWRPANLVRPASDRSPRTGRHPSLPRNRLMAVMSRRPRNRSTSSWATIRPRSRKRTLSASALTSSG